LAKPVSPPGHDVDNLASAAKRHCFHNPSDKEEGAPQVDAKHSVPVGDRQDVYRRRNVDAGVVDEDV